MFGLFRLQTIHGTVLAVNIARRELVHLPVHNVDAATPAAYLYLPEAAPGLGFLSFDNPGGLAFAPRLDRQATPILTLRTIRRGPLPQVSLSHPHKGLFLLAVSDLDADGLGLVAYHSDEPGDWERLNLLATAPEERTAALSSFMATVDAVLAAEPTPAGWAALLDCAPGPRQLRAQLLLHALVPSRSGPLSQAALRRPDMLAFLRQAFPADPWIPRALQSPNGPARALLPASVRQAWDRLRGRVLPEPPAARPIGPELDGIAGAGTDGGFASLPHLAAVLARRAAVPTRDLCIVATARNEGVYLLDWIAYHRSVGVDGIIVYSNGNDDGSDELLAALAAAGEITWYSSTVGPGGSPQGKAYAHALSIATDVLDYRWCAVIDLDEYLGFDAGWFRSVPDYLDWQDIRAVDAIALNWLMFASCGETAWQPAPVAERFQRRMPGVNPHVKTVFRPQRYHDATPHYPCTDVAQSVVFRNAAGGVHTTRRSGQAAATSEHPTADTAWISHYFFRSAEEYLSKFSRTRGDEPFNPGRTAIPPGFIQIFLEQAAGEQVEDTRTLRCSAGAAVVKQGLLAIPTVAAAARRVAARRAELRTASLPTIDALLAAAEDDASRTFLAMVRDGISAVSAQV